MDCVHFRGVLSQEEIELVNKSARAVCARATALNPVPKLEEIMAILTRKGYSYQVSHRDIEKAIVMARGIDKRTINRWINLLVMFQFLKPISQRTYEINILKLKIGELLRNQPQTHIG